MTQSIINQKRLKELIQYDPNTGIFVWLVSRCGVKSGSIAGRLNANGYIEIKIDYVSYQAHRLGWLYVSGKWPKDEIDHVNHIRDDNRWENLREADRTMNSRNCSLSENNTSGTNGVSWNKFAGKWQARIKVNGKCISLGYFKTLFAAAYARHTADIKYGYHKNHGK